ncbi:MAG: General stress protein 69 [Pelotomaculum sp. PtaU1.Bin035]|nr:MAG: General stress protein 69 [Pelotomaculum sp. PtaU1.Bin035]
MQYRVLGNTGIKVSRLCFGALTVGPLQSNLSITEGARVIRKALEAGVNFIDTAELYGTYSYIREALRGYDRDVAVVSKCYAHTYQGMRESVEKALKALGRDYIDVFLLHEQESMLTIKGHWEAIEYLLEAKSRGTVRAIGVSTHNVEGVLGAADFPEIDVIHPLINVAGVGIQGGTADDMLQAIRYAFSAGKGIYAMKALGGGNLLNRSEEAFEYIMSIPELASVAVGMSTVDEVEYNTRLFSGSRVPQSLKSVVARQPRRLYIENWCLGCGECVGKCSSGALSLTGGKAVVDGALCTLCGYCGPVCREFCIKII